MFVIGLIGSVSHRKRNKFGVILRRPNALACGRLEGWQHARRLLPSFETRAFGALLRMTPLFAARGR
jgi:hypothetical protein